MRFTSFFSSSRFVVMTVRRKIPGYDDYQQEFIQGCVIGH
jgi:hypothetical protein